MVFEHVGANTWAGSMLSLKIGGRMVICGSTTGAKAEINLFNLFRQQFRVFGSFGGSLRNIHDVLDKFSNGAVDPVVNSTNSIHEMEGAFECLESRQIFGKTMVTF